MPQKRSRLLIAGLSGDSGKTLVSLGVLANWREEGLNPVAFKKGPDYIDAAWLSAASGKSAHNLDTYLMSSDIVFSSFDGNFGDSEIGLIEGNRGLYDGVDSEGVHSAAELAKLLRTPVVIVMDVTKMTRTSAAVLRGLQSFDDKVHIAGAILNRVAGKRHEDIIRQSIESYSDIPVLGAIPKLKNKKVLPDRHLGLVTPQEHPAMIDAIENAAEIVKGYVNLEKLKAIAQAAVPLRESASMFDRSQVNGSDLRIGYFQDSAFTFYYPENLSVLRESGAELIPISSISDSELPDIDLLYIGGGFPETHLVKLAENRSLMSRVKKAAGGGLPIYAECGGLIYLSEAIIVDTKEIPMAGVLPVKVELFEKPQGHGYCELAVDAPNTFYQTGTRMRGHEFHYTGIVEGSCPSAFRMKRGVGCFGERDGLIVGNVLANYTHVHALGTPEWSSGLIEAARKYKISKNTNDCSNVDCISV
ncbi:MAG: hydrogenobyrinic acid a,c-diamide synthase (glutamine-hydrolyzing) [candidate division Zixibacteria bacterium]|nr:hydrogenobyrinic acid a,c-diamide synthase (glutamine-hydrolyzing) [candidate division Zixibacteria bacterium]